MKRKERREGGLSRYDAKRPANHPTVPVYASRLDSGKSSKSNEQEGSQVRTSLKNQIRSLKRLLANKVFAFFTSTINFYCLMKYSV